MAETKKLPVFWWSETRLMGKQKENYGDLLSKYIIEKISGKPVKWVQPKKQAWYKWNKQNYLGSGSIIHHATKDSIVWGSGIIDRKQEVVNANFKAVRGPETRKYLVDKGYSCPELYGDPALLLPKYFNPEIKKKYEIGIIPHYNDFKEVSELYNYTDEIKVIDLMTLDIEKTTSEILECRKVISSSLHGLIIAHAYNIPAIWVEFSDKLFGDGIKFIDYFRSIDIDLYKPEYLKEKIGVEDFKSILENKSSLPLQRRVEKLQDDLLNSNPFSH